MSESARIADQLRRAFAGDAWHGDSLRELLAGVDARQAAARPLPQAHSIWEIVLHIRTWVDAALAGTRNLALPKPMPPERDWPPVKNTDAASWKRAVADLFDAGQKLADTIAKLDDARLKEIVLGRDYDFYHLLHGVVQHSLYHAGQIALLKKAPS